MKKKHSSIKKQLTWQSIKIYIFLLLLNNIKNFRINFLKIYKKRIN